MTDIQAIIDKIVEEKRKLCPDDMYLNPQDRDSHAHADLENFLKFLEKHFPEEYRK